MKIHLNGQTLDVQARTLSDLLAELEFENTVVATALNGNFVPANERRATHIAAEDRVEVLTPMQGG